MTSLESNGHAAIKRFLLVNSWKTSHGNSINSYIGTTPKSWALGDLYSHGGGRSMRACATASAKNISVRTAWPRQSGRPLSEPSLVLATVLDRHFGYGPGSKPNSCQIGGPGRQLTQSTHSGTVPWWTPNPFESGGLSAGCPVGPSIDSYKALEFAVC